MSYKTPLRDTLLEKIEEMSDAQKAELLDTADKILNPSEVSKEKVSTNELLASESETSEEAKRLHDLPGNTPMLTMVEKETKRQSFAYAYLLHAQLTGANGDHTILLDFGFCQVILAGPNLQETYQEITAHKAKIVHKQDSATLELRKSGVSDITVVRGEDKK